MFYMDDIMFVLIALVHLCHVYITIDIRNIAPGSFLIMCIRLRFLNRVWTLFQERL